MRVPALHEQDNNVHEVKKNSNFMLNIEKLLINAKNKLKSLTRKTGITTM